MIDGIFGLALLLLLYYIYRGKNRYPYKTLGAWFGLLLITETTAALVRGGGSMLFFFLVVVLFLWMMTYFVIKKEKRRLSVGFLFNMSSLATIAFLTTLVFFSASFLIRGIDALLFLFFGTMTLFGGYALLIFLFWNAREVLKKESRTLGNMLTLFIGVFGLIYLSLSPFLDTLVENQFFAYLFLFVSLLFAYYFLCFLTVLTSSVLFHLMKPAFNKDYLIVLGAGLINGEKVTPLLAGRIDAAIDFMIKQEKITRKKAQLLMSGGQGKDEKIPESIAMKRYAQEKGILGSRILTEEKSTTTQENLLYAKKIMENASPYFESAFVSNEYHIFRAGLFAKKLGLTSDGIGSKTASYFIPNAFIREFIAIVLMNKKRHLIVTAGIVLLVLLFAILEIYFVK